MKRKTLAFAALIGVVGVSAVALAAQLTGQWTVAGLNPANTRNQAAETRIGVTNVDRLEAKWALDTAGDVSATPAVHGRFVYVPDWEGNIYAVDRDSGQVAWQRAAAGITGVPAKDSMGGPGGVVRTTPAVAGNLLIMGDQGGRVGYGAKVFALDRTTGETRWVTQLQGFGAGGDNSPGSYFAIVTQSPIVDDNNPNVVYVGTASWEEAMAAFIPGYPCCSFRGIVSALDVRTGRVLWQTYMAPAGYSGNGVWGSTAAIDAKRKSLYVTTGNNYSVPATVLDCVENAADDAAKLACLDAANHFDSIVALNLETGHIRWATRALPYDAWNVDCIDLGFPHTGACPDPAGPDYDFGQGPLLFEANVAGKKRDLVGAGQKSGKFWALDRDTGAVAWMTEVGPGGTMGGLQWGSAVDDRRIYVAVNNSGETAWQPLNGASTSAGAWSALDKNTGQILWQTVTPDPPLPMLGSAIGPMTVANGVAYACSFAGTRVALRATDGVVLWDEPSTGELCGAGAAVSQGTVFWGIGYGQIAFQGTANGKLTAYTVN